MITVVGSFNLDLVIEVPRFPATGESILGKNFRRACGGKGANQACAMARMGMQTHMIGSVGCDTAGDEMLAALRLAGVDISSVLRRDDVPSGMAMIWIDATGQNQIVVAGGANDTLSEMVVHNREEQICRSQALVVQLETPLPGVIAALRLARAARVLTVLNPAPFVSLPDEVLKLCDYLIPNAHEATQLSGVEIIDIPSAQLAARALRTRSGANVVITLGAEGVWLDTNVFTGLVPAVRVEAVDSVGAGDTFIGAFVVRLVEGASPLEAAQFGCAAAALSVTRRGAQASIPERDEVDRLIATAGASGD